MGFIDRIIQRRVDRAIEEKSSMVQALLTPGGTGVVWSDKDYENFAKETYLKNVIAFRCIDLIAKSVSSVPWSVFRDIGYREREEVFDHPMRSILKRANPDQSFNALMQAQTAYLVMNGNCYFERVGATTGPRGNVPKELFPHRPDRMKILVNPSTGAITGYEYSMGGAKTAKWVRDQISGRCDILHIKNFHPTNDFYGAGNTEPTAREIDTANEMTSWNKGLLQNEARPGMVFSVKGFLTDQQAQRLKTQLKEHAEGGRNAGKTLILEGEGGVDAKPYAWSPAELDYIEGGRELARRIAYGYGVPPQMVGIAHESTYSNYQEARLSFWEETIFYYLQFFKAELNYWLFPDEEKVFLDYLPDDVPALAVKRDALWKRANESNFITINQKLEMVDLPAIGPEGDVVLVPSSMVPLGEQLDVDETVEEEPDEEPEEKPEDDETEKP